MLEHTVCELDMVRVDWGHNGTLRNLFAVRRSFSLHHRLRNFGYVIYEPAEKADDEQMIPKCTAVTRSHGPSRVVHFLWETLLSYGMHDLCIIFHRL